MRSASAFFRPSRRPFGSKAVFGSAPAKSWSRMASGIHGSLRLGMVGLLRPVHAHPTHEIPDSPGELPTFPQSTNYDAARTSLIEGLPWSTRLALLLYWLSSPVW